MQHEPKQMTMPSDDVSAMHESSEYLGEINERIDVLMSVGLDGLDSSGWRC